MFSIANNHFEKKQQNNHIFNDIFNAIENEVIILLFL